MVSLFAFAREVTAAATECARFSNWSDFLTVQVWSCPDWVTAGATVVQVLLLFAAALIAYVTYLITARAARTAFSANRLSDAYDLFTREWKDKQLAPPIVFYHRYDAVADTFDIIDEEAGKRLFEEQEARDRLQWQAAAARPLRTVSLVGQRVADVFASPSTAPAIDNRIHQVALRTRQMVRQRIRRHYKFGRISPWDESNDLGPIRFKNDASGRTLAFLRKNMEDLWCTAQIRGRWEKDATFVLTVGLQDLGAYARIGAVPINHVCINGARLIIEEWVYCMGRVYGDFRRGDGNITLNSEPADRFIGASRRHAEWLACVAAIYWARVYRKGYVNYYILELEAELTRQKAVQKALQRRPSDVAGALQSGVIARDQRLQQASNQPGGFLSSAGNIRHIREREKLLREIDERAINKDARGTVRREIKQMLRGWVLPFQ